MITAIMQPYLFPYLGYFQLINLSEKFILYDDVQYIKNGWINRNRMLVNNASAWFTLSVRHADHKLAICERQWNDAPKETTAIMRRMEAAYRRAPFFEETRSVVRTAFNFPSDNLAESLTHALRTICVHLGLATPLLASRTLELESSLTGQDRVLEICARMGTTIYVNPPGGRDLYDQESFQQRGMALHFLQPRLDAYKQFGAPFISGLSIIDVLMFNGHARVREMLADCSLT